MTGLLKEARELVAEAAHKLSPLTYLRSAVRQMDEDTVRALAVAYLLAQVRTRKRAEVRTIEQDAQVERVKYQRTPEEQAELDRIDAKATRELWAGLNEAMDRYKARLRVEWTRELLDAEFATGDGQMVRWGNATVEQHEYRVALHRQNAVAGIEGAARHQQAIETLQQTGAASLYEAVKVAA